MSEKRAPNDQNLPFKEKEKEGGEGKPQLSGLWKVPMLSGQWKVPMFGDLWKEKDKHHFHLFSLSPQ